MGQPIGENSLRPWPLLRLKSIHIAIIFTYLGLALSLSAIIEEISLPFLVLVYAGLSFGIINGLRERPWVIPEVILSIMVILGAALLFFNLRIENFWPNVASFLLLIITAKAFGPHRPRDLLQLQLLNTLVLIMGAALRGPEILGLFFFEGLLSLITLVFLYFAHLEQDLLFREALQAGAYALAFSTVVMALTGVFFVTLPWPKKSFFFFPEPALQSFMSAPLAVGKLELPSRPVFRAVWLHGKRPRLPYWRCVSYDTYYQGRWLKLRRQEIKSSPIKGKSLKYRLILRLPTDALPILGLPQEIRPAQGLKLLPGFELVTSKFFLGRYEVWAVDPPLLPKDLDPKLYLQVPSEIKERLKALAQRLKRPSPLATALTIKAYLTSHYTYSLEPGEPKGDPVLYFLFRRKSGHCEYFASAMALLLRTAGIPARVVSGYLGGEWIPRGHYFLVRQSEAHLWVEAWIKDGWQRFDPTPAIPPNRGLRDLLERNLDYLFFLGEDLAFSLKEGHFLKGLFPKIKIRNFQKAYIFWFIIVLAGFFSIFFLWKRWFFSPDPVEEFLALWPRYGLKRKPGETLAEFAKRAGGRFPHLAGEIKAFVEEYYQLAYGQRGNEEALKKDLQRLKQKLRPKR